MDLRGDARPGRQRPSNQGFKASRQAERNLDLRLEYTGEFASHFQDNTAALKVSYHF